jgi:23S rRNA G2445 N2-methylase RlmL
MVHAGLEEVAGEEVERDFAGEIKKNTPGIVVFRVPEIQRELLNLKTAEDLFVFAWGTDALTYRAEDLDKIRRWTEREANWPKLLSIHHSIRPKPKGKPTYRLVVQMTGEHGYRRVDAQKALARGLAGKLPASWRYAEENASIEIWLTIHGNAAVCGIRLSDRTMRHRTYKFEHFKASLRPTVAAAMVRLADIKPGQTILDPMCGAGTILAEVWLSKKTEAIWRKSAWAAETESQFDKLTEEDDTVTGGEGEEAEPITSSPRQVVAQSPSILGGDIDGHHVKMAQTNLRRLGQTTLKTWDARKLPLEAASVDRILCNPPFGLAIGDPEDIAPLYRDMIKEMNRVLRPGGKAVLIVSDVALLRDVVKRVGWFQQRFVRVRVLGQKTSIQVYRKPNE